MNVFSILSLQAKTAAFLLETQTVMALRMLGMSGVLPLQRDESLVMFAEKAPALVRAISAGNTALMLGKRPDQVLDAALKPLASKVRANRKRLMK